MLGRIEPVGLPVGGVKLNVYGRSGTGKTTFACTFPKPLLLVGAEDGTRSVHNVRGVDFVRLQETEELRSIAEFLQSSESKYKTVVLDSASSLQDMVLKELLGLEELPPQGSWGMASREAWTQCALKTKEWMRVLLQLQAHVVITAQEREFNVENDSDLLMPYVASALTPSVTGWLNPACDYITQTFIRESFTTKATKVGDKTIKRREKTGAVEYCLRTGPDPVYTTKFRLPKGKELPLAVVDPTYSKLERLIEGK